MDCPNLSYSTHFNLKTQSSWRKAFDDQKYIMKNSSIFLTERLDNIAKLEQRFIEINSKWKTLSSDLLNKIDDRMYLNSNANIAVWNGDDCWNVWYHEPNQKGLFSINLNTYSSKKWLERYTIFYEKESVLAKFREKALRFSDRTELFRTALEVAIERFINKSNNYNSLEKEYNQTGKASGALMALNDKLVVLNFSGREYWYKYSMEYRTRGADKFPRLYKVCWSDHIPTRFTFGESK